MTFSPSINLAINGAVAIADNASAGPKIYNLSGTGVLPSTFSVSGLSFTAQTVGTTSAPKVVTVTNKLSTPVNVASGISCPLRIENGRILFCRNPQFTGPASWRNDQHQRHEPGAPQESSGNRPGGLDE